MKKNIIITGGSDGLGKHTAKMLTDLGHKVIILARNKNKLETVAKKIKCDYQVCDISNYKNIEQTMIQILKKYPKIDCLINNAGVWIKGQLEDNTPEEIARVININTIGTIYMTKAIIPVLKKQNSGTIINIISTDGLCSKADRSVYHASKWALTGFTKCIQQDLNPYNIQITGFYPGLMNTKLFSKNGVNRDTSQGLSPKNAAEVISSIVNLPPDIVIPDISLRSIKYDCSLNRA